MAKGLRSSSKKTNRSKLGSRVFKPVEDARTERLSAKLLELASTPKPPRAEMDVEQNTEVEHDGQVEDRQAAAEAMDMDQNSTTKQSSSKSRKTSGRVQKKRRGKSSSTIVFSKRQLKGGRSTSKNKK